MFTTAAPAIAATLLVSNQCHVDWVSLSMHLLLPHVTKVGQFYCKFLSEFNSENTLNFWKLVHFFWSYCKNKSGLLILRRSVFSMHGGCGLSIFSHCFALQYYWKYTFRTAYSNVFSTTFYHHSLRNNFNIESDDYTNKITRFLW